MRLQQRQPFRRTLREREHGRDAHKDANLAGTSISQCRLDGMTINGIEVTELLAAYNAAQEAK
jgi:hypothetical protein